MTDKAGSPRAARALFVATLLTGSFLLFLVQPLVARMALPRLGGAPAVWNSAMLVYQALLLVGYAYADALGRLRPRVQALVHLAVFAVAAAWLPVSLAGFGQPAGLATELWVPWLLAVSIGPLFVAVAAQAPLMQRWYVLSGRGGDPYWLYAASNIGSFAGLIAYPLLFEPLLTVHGQARGWSVGFVALFVLMAVCAIVLWRTSLHPSPSGEGLGVGARGLIEGAGKGEGLIVDPAPSWRRRATWILLAAIPSGLMLSTTTSLTTDIGAVPLLWVVPLGLYLLSFSLAFAANGRPATIVARLLPYAIVAAALVAASSLGGHPLWSGAAGTVLLFVAAVTLHRALYALRPGPARLTGFYLAMSIGGALGGLFCAIVAPAMFDWTYEHPILILAVALAAPARAVSGALRRFWAERAPRLRRSLIVGLAAMMFSNLGSGLFVPVPAPIQWLSVALIILMALACAGRRWLFAWCVLCELLAAGGWRTLHISTEPAMRTRSYFGVYTVVDRAEARQLISGTTLHGVQLKAKGFETFPTSYYAYRSGIGLAMSTLPVTYGPHARVGVVGLGSGTLACYREPGQDWRFYEIDPAVVAIASDPRRFTFLGRCAPHLPIELGDARLTLAARPHPPFDLLAVDAFSSDAVPTHLLTLEAFAIYRRALAPNGLLLVHVSNRFMDLSKVVAAAARAQGWQVALRDYKPTHDEMSAGASRSIWIALSPDRLAFDSLVYGHGKGNEWQPLAPTPGFRAWTDDHMSVLTVLRWKPY